jgi:peptidoglycan-associated lipoprotein
MRIRPALTKIIAFTAIVLAVGCGKKTTKLENTLPEPEPSRPPVYTPEQETKFVAQDMDEEMRRILVPVYFDYDRYNLRSDAVEIMEKIASFLEQHKGIRILIEGHADERGTDEYNMGLGENRARSARNYLTGYGLSGNRFEMVTFGKSRPANPSCNDDPCHQLNRRVEWKVLSR